MSLISQRPEELIKFGRIYKLAFRKIQASIYSTAVVIHQRLKISPGNTFSGKNGRICNGQGQKATNGCQNRERDFRMTLEKTLDLFAE